MRSLASWSAIALAALVATSASSERSWPVDEEIDELIGPTISESVQVHGERVPLVGASVTTLDTEKLEVHDLRSAADAVALAPGVRLDRTSSRGGATTLQMRGGDPNQVLVTLDGVPLNDPTDPFGGSFNLSSIPLEQLEAIEIARGALSSPFGGTALGGAINLRTKRGDGPARVVLTGGLGSNDLGRASLAFSQGGQSWRGFALASWETESDVLPDDDFEQLQVVGSVSRDIANGEGDFSLVGRLGRWTAEDYSEGSGGPRLGTGELRDSEHEEGSLSTSVSHPMGERWDATWFLGYSRHDVERLTPAIPPAIPEIASDTRYDIARLDFSALRSGPGPCSLQLGLTGQHERASDDASLKVSLMPPFALDGSYEVDRSALAVRASVIRETAVFSWEAGLLVDLIEDGSPEWNPRLGLAWRPEGTNLRLRASLSRAFKLPGLSAQFGPPEVGGNPELMPETSWSADLGLDWSNDAGSSSGGVTVFGIRYEDLVDFDFGSFTHLNRGLVEAFGVELWHRWTPNDRLRVGVSATWQDVDDRETGEPLRERPRTFGSVDVAWSPATGWWLGADLTARASMLDEQVPVFGAVRIPGHVLVGLAASWTSPNERLRVSTRIDNLLDEDYEHRLGFPAEGISGRVEVALRLR